MKIVTRFSWKGVAAIIISLILIYFVSTPALNFYFDHQKVYTINESSQNISWANVIVVNGVVSNVTDGGEFILKNDNISLYVHKTEKINCVPKNNSYVKVAGAYNFIETNFNNYKGLETSGQYIPIGKQKFLATKSYGFFGVWVVNGC